MNDFIPSRQELTRGVIANIAAVVLIALAVKHFPALRTLVK